MLKVKFFFILLFIFGLLSCQSNIVLEKTNLEYNKLPKFIFISESKEVINNYKTTFERSHFEQSIKNPPIFYLNNWFDNNIKTIGVENKLVISILNASILKKIIPNPDLKKYQEKNILLFESEYVVEYLLYDDSNFLLASALVETKKTITSSKNISLEDSDRIVENLIFQCLSELTNKSHELILLHMKNFIL